MANAETSSLPAYDQVIDKSLDVVFKNKHLAILLIVFFVGMGLRYFGAVSVEPNADEMQHGPHAWGIIDAGVIGRVWQSILWSYLTDGVYRVLGITLFSARFLSFLFGSLSIILVYLLGREIFDKRAALIAATLMAFSAFTSLYTLMEMDLAAIFFVLLAALLFIRQLKKDGKLSWWAAVFIGVGGLIKTLALFFVPAFFIGYLAYHRGWTQTKRWTAVITFGLLVTLVFSPILIHNLLWYQDKGMVDAYLAQFFAVGNTREAYAGIAGVNDGFRFNDALVGGIGIIKGLLRLDPLITLLGILGMAFFSLKKERWSVFFVAFQAFSFLGIDLTNRLETHYIIFLPVLALYGGALLPEFAERCKGRVTPRTFIGGALVLIFLVNAWIMLPYLSTPTAMREMRDYASTNIGPDDLVVADSRIYRGRIMWLFMDKHYLESAYFSQIVEQSRALPGKERAYRLLFVECVPDDCGWGTIKNQPEFNASSESIVQFFRENAREEKVIAGGGTPLIPAGEPYFRVYSASINLKPGIIPAIDATHVFFYYPAGYKPRNQIFDSYSVNGPVDKLLFVIAKLIIWLSFATALASVVVVGVLFARTIRADSKK